MSKSGKQIEAGNIFGTVTDNEGQPFPGVTLTLSGPGPTEVQVTCSEGKFHFVGLVPVRML